MIKCIRNIKYLKRNNNNKKKTECVCVCVPFGRVTREHRENLAKLAKQLSNKAKESLRRVRSSAVTQTKKAKEGHSEDTIRLVEKQVGAVPPSSTVNL